MSGIRCTGRSELGFALLSMLVPAALFLTGCGPQQTTSLSQASLQASTETRTTLATTTGMLPITTNTAATRTATTIPVGDDRYPFLADGKYGFIDAAGQVVIQPQYEWFMDNDWPPPAFSEGLAAVWVEGKWGFIDTSGRMVIPPRSYAGPPGIFSEGLCAVKPDTEYEYGYIDTTGKMAISPNYDTGADPFSEGLALVRIGNDHGYIDTSGRMVIQPQFEVASSFHYGLACVLKDGRRGYIDTHGQMVIDIPNNGFNDFSEGLAPVVSGGKWGFMDTSGQMVIQPQYDGAGGFSDGLAAVSVDGKTGFIDTSGRMVIQPKSGWFDPFFDGMAVVSDGRIVYGFIDTTGTMVIPYEYDDVGPVNRGGARGFSHGLAAVLKDDRWGYIDTSGQLVFQESSPRPAGPVTTAAAAERTTP